MSSEVEYHVGDRVWTHAWGSHEIGEEELGGDLASAGLRFGRWLTDDQSWFGPPRLMSGRLPSPSSPGAILAGPTFEEWLDSTS
jgi:hypothetical protein